MTCIIFFLFPQAMYGSACFPIALSTGKALKLCNSCGRDRRETAPRCSFHFISLVMTEVEHFFINLRIIFFFGELSLHVFFPFLQDAGEFLLNFKMFFIN